VSTISGVFNFDLGELQPSPQPLTPSTPAVTLLDSLLIYVLTFSCDKGSHKNLSVRLLATTGAQRSSEYNTAAARTDPDVQSWR